MFGKTTTVLFWVCALCCFWAFHEGMRRRAAALRPVRWAESGLERWQRWLIPACVGLAVIFGLFMRLYRFPEFPGGVNQDGAMAASDAMALAQYGTDRLGTPWPAHLEAWGKGQMSALLSYLLAGTFRLFGVSRLTLRLPQMLISLLSIAVGWDFARRALGKRFGWVALCLLLINPWHIMQSRWTIDCALFPHFFLFGAYCLLRGYDHKAWFYGAMVCFALSMYCYGIAMYTIPPFLIAAVAALLCLRRIRWYDALGCAALYLLISAPFLATMLLNYVGGESFTLFGFTIQYFKDSVRASEIVLMQENWYAGFVRNTQYLLNVLLYQTDGYLYMDLPEHGSNYLFALPLIVAGVAGVIADRVQKRVAWLALPERANTSDEAERVEKARWGLLIVILWLLAAAWATLLTDQAHLGRAAILMYPVILCVAYAVYRIGNRQRVLAAALAAAFLIGGFKFGTDYFAASTQRVLGRYYYAGLIEAIEASRGRSFDVLYLTQTFPEENQYGMPEEVLIEYAQRLDARYAYGDKEIADPDGRVWRPFDERYQLVHFEDFFVDPQEEALYVAFGQDIEYFDPEAFVFERFGDYYLITPNVLRE